MTKNTEAFGGFDELVDMLTMYDKDPKVTKIDTVDPIVDPVDPDLIDPVDPDDPDEPIDPVEPDEPIDPVDPIDPDEPGEPIDPSDLGEVEPEISAYFAESLINKLGIELTDKDVKFEKLDDVIDLMTEVIQTNSKPEFANDEVAEYDQYVRNGGNLRAFYDDIYKDSVNIDTVDIESESDQKAIIETNLKNLGYKEERIKKVIDRYVDAEVLKDEAEDALESIKEFQSKKAKTLLAEQENLRIDTEKRNKEFFDNVVKYVDNLKDVLGVEIDPKSRKEVIDYIFRVQSDGTTGYQKDYASDIVKSLVESAYLKKYGASLLDKTNKKATNVALNKVRDKLKTSKGKRNTGSGSGLGKASPNFSTLSGLIIK